MSAKRFSVLEILLWIILLLFVLLALSPYIIGYRAKSDYVNLIQQISQLTQQNLQVSNYDQGFFSSQATLTLTLPQNSEAILFKEETSFYKEIHIGENIDVHMELEGVSKGIERWRFTPQIFNKDGILAAEIKVYGAWIDLMKRKLTAPPAKFVQIFEDLPKTKNFKEILLKSAK